MYNLTDEEVQVLILAVDSLHHDKVVALGMEDTVVKLCKKLTFESGCRGLPMSMWSGYKSEAN